MDSRDVPRVHYSSSAGGMAALHAALALAGSMPPGLHPHTRRQRAPHDRYRGDGHDDARQQRAAAKRARKEGRKRGEGGQHAVD